MENGNADYAAIERQRYKAAQAGGWSSIAVNLVIFGLKLWVGLAGNSLLLITDAWHTLSDSITSVIVLISSFISKKPADKEHPYGHGRAEMIATLVIGVILTAVALEFIREAVTRLIEGGSPQYSLITGIVIFITIIVKKAMGHIALKLGQKYDLASLRADGYHHNSDAYSSIAVLAGIISGLIFDLWWVDAFLSGVVAIYIAYTAYEIIAEAADCLMGAPADQKLLTDVTGICSLEGQKYEISLFPHHFHLHKYGRHKELTFHVLLPAHWSIGKGHELIKTLEDKIKTKLNVEATIHIDPEINDNKEGKDINDPKVSE